MCYVISIESIPVNERFFVYMSRTRLTVLPNTLNSGWTRIASGLLILAFIVMQRVITLGRDRRA
jgi:hypothetical protein